MSNKTFEIILEENKVLNDLITERSPNILTQFPSKDKFSDAFLDWVSPKYYDTFLDIYNTHYGKKTESKIISVIKSPWYCNSETEEKLINFLTPHIEATEKLSTTLRKNIEAKSDDLVAILENSGLVMKSVLNYFNKGLIKQNHPRITSFKNHIIDDSLVICEKLKKYKASSDIEFGVFNALLDSFNTVQLNPEQKNRLEACKSKAKSSSNKYIAITVIIAIIALIRLFARFS